MSIPGTILRQLADALSELYPDTARARTMATTADLEVQNIPLGSTTYTAWVAILEEAERQGRSAVLLRQAESNYPSAAPLAEGVKAYAAWVAAGRPKLTTATPSAPLARLSLEVPPPPIFAGRSAEQQRLMKILLHMPEPASAALQGFGGMGKTTLAQKVTHDVSASFRAGALWVSIGPGAAHGDRTTPAPAPEGRQANILADIAASLQLDLSQTPRVGDQASFVQRDLARRGRLLAVFDDLWDVDLGRWLIRDTLPPDRVVLVTSRDLGLCKALCDHVQRLGPLTVESGALDLLARYLDVDSPLGRYEPDARELVRLLEGHPLALMLAARLCLEGLVDLPGVLRRLKQKPTLGVLKLRGTERRDTSVEASFALSYEDLDPDLQRRLRALGIFAPSPFALPAVAAVWGDTDINTAAEMIDALRAGGFLQGVEPTTGSTRPEYESEPAFRQHSLLRAYALALLERSGEAEPVRQRYLEYYQTLPGRQAEKWQAADPYWPQVEQAWQYAQQQGSGAARRFYADLRVYMTNRARHPSQLAWASNLLALPVTEMATDERAILLEDVGQVHRITGQPQLALESYDQALVAQRAAGDPAGEAATLTRMAAVYQDIGQPQTALDLYRQAQPIQRALPDPAGEAATLNGMGHAYKAMGQPTEALALYTQALVIRRSLGNQGDIAATLHNMGLVYRDMGQPQRALELLEQALPILVAVGNRFAEATARNSLATVYTKLGQLPRALEFYQQALPIRREVGDRAGEATTLNGIGLVYYGLGQREQALTLYEQALAIRREVKDRAGEAGTLHNMAAVYRMQGQLEQASALYQQALPIMREVEDRDGEATTLNGLAMVYQLMAQPEQALVFLQDALQIRIATANVPDQAATLNNLGRVYLSLGQPEPALQHYQQALALWRQAEDPAGEAATLHNLAEVHAESLQEPMQAAVYLERAIAVLQETGLPADAAGRTVEHVQADLAALRGAA